MKKKSAHDEVVYLFIHLATPDLAGSPQQLVPIITVVSSPTKERLYHTPGLCPCFFFSKVIDSEIVP